MDMDYCDCNGGYDYDYEDECVAEIQENNLEGCQGMCRCCCCGCPGPTGPQGPRGPRGFTGPQGPMGPSGPRGFTGATGQVGPRGLTGDTGPRGDKGERGDVGPVGATGATGPIGPIGPVGPAGPIGPAGATGAQGATGPIGPIGPEGPTGPAGPEGPTVTTTSMFAANITDETLNVTSNGISVRLPDGQNLDGFTASPNNRQFTVPVTGRYYISYEVNLAVAVLLKSQLLINNVVETGAVRGSLIGRTYSADIILDLNSGDVLEIELVSPLPMILTLENGVGASLNIIRLG